MNEMMPILYPIILPPIILPEEEYEEPTGKKYELMIYEIYIYPRRFGYLRKKVIPSLHIESKSPYFKDRMPQHVYDSLPKIEKIKNGLWIIKGYININKAIRVFEDMKFHLTSVSEKIDRYGKYTSYIMIYQYNKR